jgi:hypothetical protein
MPTHGLPDQANEFNPQKAPGSDAPVAPNSHSPAIPATRRRSQTPSRSLGLLPRPAPGRYLQLDHYRERQPLRHGRVLAWNLEHYSIVYSLTILEGTVNVNGARLAAAVGSGLARMTAESMVRNLSVYWGIFTRAPPVRGGDRQGRQLARRAHCSLAT